MHSRTEQLVIELIRTRPELTYFQIAVIAGTNWTAVANIAKEYRIQRGRGRRKMTSLPPAPAQSDLK